MLYSDNILKIARSSHQRYSVRRGVLRNFKNTFARVSFLIKRIVLGGCLITAEIIYIA